MVLTPSGEVSVYPGGQLTIPQLQHKLELYRMECHNQSQSGKSRSDTRRQLAIVTPVTELELYLTINRHNMFNITRS